MAFKLATKTAEIEDILIYVTLKHPQVHAGSEDQKRLVRVQVEVKPKPTARLTLLGEHLTTHIASQIG